jgi:hypothetical protein
MTDRLAAVGRSTGLDRWSLTMIVVSIQTGNW